VVFGMGVMWLANFCTSQTEVARYCNVSSKKRAKIALYINMVGTVLLITCACLCGVALFGVYGRCDPLKLGYIQTSDQLMPYFVMDTLSDYPGIPGLFVACVFSASLSTLSSGYNALATVTWDDFLRHTSMANWSEWKIKFTCKLIGAFYGLISVEMAFFVGLIGSVLQAAISLAGALFGPLFGLYMLALLCPFSNTPGVLIGLITGQTFTIWILIGSLIYPHSTPSYPTYTDGCASPFNTTFSYLTPQEPSEKISEGGVMALYHMAFLLVPITGFVISTVTGMIASILTGGLSTVNYTDPEHLSPIAWLLWPKQCTPTKRRSKKGENKPRGSINNNGSFDTIPAAFQYHETGVEEYGMNGYNKSSRNGSLTNGSVVPNSSRV